MKVKQIITTCGILLGSLATVGAANATVTYVGKSDVQFTFRPMLTLELSSSATPPSGHTDPTFLIDNLAPGNTLDSNEVRAAVNTNSAAGYTLSATVGDVTSPTLNTTDLVSSGTDNFGITTDNVASLGSGKWGLRVKNGTYGNYRSLDTATARTLNVTSDSTGTAATASYPGTANTDMKIGAYAKASQVAGGYQNVINFEAVANVSAHTVNLVAGTNTATATITAVDGTAITPATTGFYDEGTVLTIAATCNTGETFFGWSSNYDYGSIADKTLATTTYTVGGGSVNLTANCGAYTMQSITASMCTTTPTLVTDARDGKQYHIAKLADNECWMIDNLRFGENDTNPNTTTLAMTPDTSDVTIPRTITAYDAVEYSDEGEKCYGDWSSTDGGTGDGYTTPCIHSKDLTSGNNTIGVWYNHVAASAGTVADPGTSTTITSATESVCPKGWTLPTHTQNQALVTAIGSAPTSFDPVYGGHYSNGELSSQTGWWAATVYDGARAYRLQYDSGVLVTGFGWGRRDSIYVRCVLK